MSTIFYATTDKIKCFNCGKSGHLICACPAKNSNNPPADGDVAAFRSDVVNAEPIEAGPSDETPDVSGLGAVKDRNDDALPVFTATGTKELRLITQLLVLCLMFRQR